jgi:hypothetical protein
MPFRIEIIILNIKNQSDILDKYMQNVYHPNELTYVFYRVNVLEILDDKSDMYLMVLLEFWILLIQLAEILIEHELFKKEKK